MGVLAVSFVLSLWPFSLLVTQGELAGWAVGGEWVSILVLTALGVVPILIHVRATMLLQARLRDINAFVLRPEGSVPETNEAPEWAASQLAEHRVLSAAAMLSVLIVPGLLVMAFPAGTPGQNAYGFDPRGPDAGRTFAE